MRLFFLPNAPLFFCSSRRALAMVRPPIVVSPLKEHKATMIFLHGLGDQGDGWADMFKQSMRHDHIKYICPNSRRIPLTRRGGVVMPAWFDVSDPKCEAVEEDRKSIDEAVEMVHGLIDGEVAAGIPAGRIVLGGFSMGASLSLFAGLSYPKALAGIVGMSGRTIQRHRTPGSFSANLSTSVLICHGDEDLVVDVECGRASRDIWKEFNENVDYREYRHMGHTSCPQEMRDLRQFVFSCLKY